MLTTSQNRVFEVRLTRNSILVPLITCSVALDKYLTSVSSSVKQGVIISPSFGLSRVLNEIMYIVGYSKWSVNSSLKKKTAAYTIIITHPPHPQVFPALQSPRLSNATFVPLPLSWSVCPAQLSLPAERELQRLRQDLFPSNMPTTWLRAGSWEGLSE